MQESSPVAGRLPDYLIIGAMKAGTTSLATYLAAHPQAYLAHNKELYFFDRDQVWAKGVDWYASRFADAGNAVAVGEASPSYMFHREAPKRMASVVPEARLLAILRNPVDRAYSHYWHLRFRSREPLPFAEAIALEGRRVELGHHWEPHYLARGEYLPQLLRVLEHYPREQLHVVCLDDLQSTPVPTFQEACRFIGIDDTVVPANVGTTLNPFQEVRYPRLWRGMFRFRVWRWLPKAAASATAKAMLRPATYPPLDPVLRVELTERFRPANEALGEWLGRDLVSLWSANRAASNANGQIGRA